MTSIAVVGFGYWGPNLVRNFSAFDEACVKAVVDMNETRLTLAKKLYPSVETYTDYSEVLQDSSIDAVVIALPVSLHYPLAKAALLQGKHVLIEKPMTDSSQRALELIELARQREKVLMVDHTFLYTGAVQKIKALVDEGELGDLQYFDSVRINLGLFQHDINVLWDLAPHDLSILHYILQEPVHSVVATGFSHTANGIENIAYLTLYYQSDKIAHVHVSWTSPVKIRKILIGGARKMLVFDDLEPTEKVKVYDSSYHVTSDDDKNRILVDYRVGDVHIPKIEMTEALRGMAKDFLQAISSGKEPASSWKSGLEVVKVLEAAEKSIKLRGKEVLIQ